VPAFDRVRLHDDQGGAPISPRVGEQNPEQAISFWRRTSTIRRSASHEEAIRVDGETTSTLCSLAYALAMSGGTDAAQDPRQASESLFRKVIQGAGL